MWSTSLLDKLAAHPRFRKAKTVLLYHSLPDEVQTHEFIEQISQDKRVILPVVVGNELELRVYTGKSDLKKGSFGIDEPTGDTVTDFSSIEVAIIPGVGFDKQGNRLGRGKGYYDRLLPQLHTYNIGICFSFQVVPEIPVEPFDRPMDEVWTEEGCISERRCSL